MTAMMNKKNRTERTREKYVYLVFFYDYMSNRLLVFVCFSFFSLPTIDNRLRCTCITRCTCKYIQKNQTHKMAALQFNTSISIKIVSWSGFFFVLAVEMQHYFVYGKCEVAVCVPHHSAIGKCYCNDSNSFLLATAEFFLALKHTIVMYNYTYSTKDCSVLQIFPLIFSLDQQFFIHICSSLHGYFKIFYFNQGTTPSDFFMISLFKKIFQLIFRLNNKCEKSKIKIYLFKKNTNTTKILHYCQMYIKNCLCRSFENTNGWIISSGVLCWCLCLCRFECMWLFAG